MSSRRALDYSFLTRHERLRLFLHAVTRGDTAEAQRIEATAPRLAYKESDIYEIQHQVWSVAYSFRDTFYALEHGCDFGTEQVLGAARDVLPDEEFERVIASLNQTKSVLSTITRNDLGRASKADDVAIPPDLQKYADEFSKTIRAHYGYHRTLALLVAGLRTYAEQGGLTVEEVLAPLPQQHRSHLLATIKGLPKWIEVPDDLARRSAEALAGARLFDINEVIGPSSGSAKGEKAHEATSAHEWAN